MIIKIIGIFALLGGSVGLAEVLPHPLKQVSFADEIPMNQPSSSQRNYVIQVENVKGREFLVIMFHLGGDGLSPRPPSNRQIVVVPDKVARDLQEFLSPILDENGEFNDKAFDQLCGREGKPFGLSLRAHLVGIEPFKKGGGGIGCTGSKNGNGASKEFYRLRKELEKVYHQGKLSLQDVIDGPTRMKK